MAQAFMQVCFGKCTPEQHEPELVSVFMEYAVKHLSTTSSILRDQVNLTEFRNVTRML